METINELIKTKNEKNLIFANTLIKTLVLDHFSKYLGGGIRLRFTSGLELHFKENFIAMKLGLSKSGIRIDYYKLTIEDDFNLESLTELNLLNLYSTYYSDLVSITKNSLAGRMILSYLDYKDTNFYYFD